MKKATSLSSSSTPHEEASRKIINLPTRRRKNHEVRQVKQQVSYIQLQEE